VRASTSINMAAEHRTERARLRPRSPLISYGGINAQCDDAAPFRDLLSARLDEPVGCAQAATM